MFFRVGLKGINAVKSYGQTRGMAVITNFKKPTMAELPVPKGSWEHAYQARQRQNNAMLISGTLILFGTLVFFTQSGVVSDFGRGPAIGVNE